MRGSVPDAGDAVTGHNLAAAASAQQQTRQVEVRTAGLHDVRLQMGEQECPTCSRW
jgi:hypothetical protein